MNHDVHAPSFSETKNVLALPERESAYWNILEYCRHIGVEKKKSGSRNWLARVRLKSGRYKQTRLGPIIHYDPSGLSYGEAVAAARRWFSLTEIQSIASSPYPVGDIQHLIYEKTVEGFTVGDAMIDFVEWKRIAAAKTYFQTSLSLINHHIIPRIGNTLVEDLDSQAFSKFCLAVLESPPKRGNQNPGPTKPVEELDHESLRKRKKTLNTVVSFLRMAFQMAWENDKIASEKYWRRIKRVPQSDTPRQFFLTRKQAKKLIATCRPDLAQLVLAALYTGCRVSELCQLRARDIGGNVFGIYVAPMKSYRSRYVILPDEGMSFFLDAKSGLDDEELVFRMDSGRPWTGSHKHLFRDAVERAGLPSGFVFHGLRHTYASQLVQAGTPLAIVATQLGHSNTDTVSRTYGHLCCEGIETELATRFAPLRGSRSDARLAPLRNSLQAKHKPNWSWPQKNNSKANGEVVSILKAREEELKR